MGVGASESLGEATVKFSSDVVDFLKGLTDLAAKADFLEKQLQEVDAKMSEVAKSAGASGVAAKSSLDAAATSAKELGSSLNSAAQTGGNSLSNMGNNAAQLSGTLQSTNGAVSQLVNNVGAIGSTVVASTNVASNGMAGFGIAIAQTQQAVPALFGEFENWQPRIGQMFEGFGENVEAFRSKLTKFSSDLKAVGTQAGLLGGTMAAAFTFAVKAAIDYEAAFIGVRKTVDATEQEYAQLSNSIRGMAKELPFAATELARVAETAGQLGVQKSSITDFIKVVSDLGVSTNLIGEEGATMMAQFANRSKTAQSEFRNLGSAISALGNSGASTEKEILDMGLRLAGAGTAAGMSQGSILGIASALASVGIQAEMGGGAISRLISKISTDIAAGADTVKVFADVSGKSVQQFQDDWKNHADKALVDFIIGLTNTKKAGGDLFQVFSELNIDGTLLKDTLLSASISSEMFAESIRMGNDAYRDATALAKEAAQFYASHASQIQVLKNNFMDMAITIGETLIPAVSKWTEYFTKAIDSFAGWQKANPQEFSDWINTLVKTAGSLVVFSTVSFILAGFFGAINGGIGLVSSLVLGFKALFTVTNGIIGLSLTGVIMGWVVGIGIAAAGVYKIAAAFKEAYDAMFKLIESSEALDKKTNEYITTLEKSGTITKAQADELRGMADAQAKHAAAVAAGTDAVKAKYAELDAQLAIELQNRLGREATITEMNRARIAMEGENVTAAQAADLALSNIETNRLSRIAVGNATDQQQLQTKAAYYKKVQDESKLSTDVVVDHMNQQLQKMGEIYASESELVGAKDYAAKYEITLLDGLLAYRKGFTAQQIAMIGQASMAEIAAMQQTDVARKQSVNEEAMDLATRMQNVQAFSEFNTQRIAELKVQREQIIAEIQQLRTQDNASDAALTTEQQARMTQLTQMYLQNTDQMSVAAQTRRDVAVAVEQQIAEKEAESLGVAKEVAQANMDNSQIQQRALDELATKHKSYIDQVISSNQQSRESFESANSRTQEDIRGTIALWAESGTSVQQASVNWQDAYKKLPMSGGDNPLDKAVKDFGTYREYLQATANAVVDASEQGHQALSKFAMGTPGSPAPLDLATKDFITYKSELNSLVSATENATDRMGRAWVAFANIMRSTSEESRRAMQNMDPTVRHSPSMVDNVLSGTMQMRKIWQQHTAAIWPIMLNAHDAMTYLDPSAHHSPSLLENMIAGYAFMSDMEKRAMRDRYFLFYRNNQDILKSFMDLYKNGGSLYGKETRQSLVKRNEIGDYVGSGVSAPTGMDLGKYISMLNELDSLLGGKTQGLESLFLNAIRQDTKSQTEAEKKSMAEEVYSTPENTYTKAEPLPVTVAPPKPADVVDYKQEWLRNAQGMGMLGLPNRRDAASLSDDAIAKIIKLIQSGGFSPDGVPSMLDSRGAAGNVGGVTINIEIGSVRTEADIEMIASKIIKETEKQRWRAR